METRATQEPSRCIWVDAGVIAYKLCDIDFRCDECPFDGAMRRVFNIKAPVARTEVAGPTTSEDAVERYFAAFDPLQFPGDRTYLPGHLWVVRNDDTSVTIDIDHVAASLVWPLASVVIPEAPTVLRAHAPCCWLVHHHGTIAIPSPFESNAVWYNAELSHHPSLLAEKPYTEGWILRAFPAQGEGSLKSRRSASENTPVVSRELNILKRELIEEITPRPHIGPSAFDGGAPVHSALEMIGPSAFASIARIFSSPVHRR